MRQHETSEPPLSWVFSHVPRSRLWTTVVHGDASLSTEGRNGEADRERNHLLILAYQSGSTSSIVSWRCYLHEPAGQQHGLPPPSHSCRQRRPISVLPLSPPQGKMKAKSKNKMNDRQRKRKTLSKPNSNSGTAYRCHRFHMFESHRCLATRFASYFLLSSTAVFSTTAPPPFYSPSHPSWRPRPHAVSSYFPPRPCATSP